MSTAWKNITLGMWILIVVGSVIFIVSFALQGDGNFARFVGIMGASLPIFYLRTIRMNKQREFATVIFIFTILGVIVSFTGVVISIALSYLGVLIIMVLILSIVLLVGNIFLLINVGKLRKEPKDNENMWVFEKVNDTPGKCELFGVNIFDFAWNHTGQYTSVQDPLYNQLFNAGIYTVDVNDQILYFAVAEFSNGVYGFFLWRNINNTQNIS
jgi:hypothetical protein